MSERELPTGAEFQFIRTRYGYTRVQCAEVVGVSSRTIEYKEQNDKPMPVMVLQRFEAHMGVKYWKAIRAEYAREQVKKAERREQARQMTLFGNGKSTPLEGKPDGDLSP